MALTSRDTAFLNLVQKSFVTHAELFSGTAAIPLNLLERVFNDRPFRLERGCLCDVGETGARWRCNDRLFRLLLVLDIQRIVIVDDCHGGSYIYRACPGGRVRWNRSHCARHLANDELLVLKNDYPLNHVFELADIAGPLIGLEEPLQFR
jgi:hypothetical protein